MMGAAVLSAKACLRSGVGKLTCYICKEGYIIMQTAVPEAMCAMFGNTFIKDIDNLKNFDVTGIGPGIGRHLSHKQLLQKVFKNSNGPVVIDADALNVLSNYSSLYKLIPEHSIITPHPKEFERLFGKSENDFDRIELALKKAKDLNIYIVLKGHYTLIATPEGKGYFNSTADRFIQAEKLYKLGIIKHILISGGNGKFDNSNFREGSWVKNELSIMGIPDSVIFVEDHSNDTFDNAAYAKQILDSLQLSPPYLLITSAHHMPRASLIFKNAGVITAPFPCNYIEGRGDVSFSSFIPNPSVLPKWNYYLKERAGYLWYYFKKK